MVRAIAVLIAVLVLAGACLGRTATAPGTVQHHPLWQQVDLPGRPNAWRAGAYDPTRDALWVLARDGMSATLTRVNLTNRSVESTPVNQDAAGWVGGFVLLDSTDHVWMAWGRTMVRYDPNTQDVKSFTMPAFITLGVEPHIFSTNGSFVAATMDPAGEIWLANDNVPALFGFNTASQSWDRTLHLPWVPYMFTRLTVRGTTSLLVNGFSSPDYTQITLQFAQVDTSTGDVTPIKATVRDYVLLDQNRVLLLDAARGLDLLDLTTGTAKLLVPNAPVAGVGGRFTVDKAGNVWFAMESYRNLGLARLDPATGDITPYPFPYIHNPGSPVPNDCPPNAVHCIPSGSVWFTDVYSIEVDSAQNIWVVTDEAGSHDPNNHDVYQYAAMAPIAELRAEDRSFRG